MQKVTLLCVGRMKEKFYLEAAAEYSKRLSRVCQLEIQEIPEERLSENPSSAEINVALAREAKLIQNKFMTSGQKGLKGLKIALCIEGKLYSSEELAELIRDTSRITFLIGGSFGLHPSIKSAADRKLSMSAMTFPHHLARVMILEQIYRAYQINLGTRYHK